MKKKTIYALIVAMMTTTGMMAQQMNAPMTFSGASRVSVMTTNIDNTSDTIRFCMNDMATGNITLPEMKGMSTIPSFTIQNASFAMGQNMTVTFPEQTFTSTVLVDGVEKTVTGESLTGTYNMADNSLDIKVVFKYGSMPVSMTYAIKGYYVKAVTNSIDVVVGGSFKYSNESVTYKVRRYNDGDITKLDVEVPAFTLDNTVIGNLSLGSYTVTGLIYDEAKEGYYRDYANDGLIFNFKAEKDGNITMNGDYPFNASKPNNILVRYNGQQPSAIVNAFQMGVMPFGIVSTLTSSATGIGCPLQTTAEPAAEGRRYSVSGQQATDSYKGIVIIGGKKYYRK